MLLLLLILHSIVLCFAQNQTIWTELATLTPFLASQIESNSQLHDLLSQNVQNLTLFLPSDAAINASIQNGALNFSLPENSTYSAFSFFILNGSYSSKAFEKASVYTTFNSSHSLYISTLSNNSIQLLSGLDQAIITKADYNCLNGVIHLIDQFLQPPLSPLDTISKLAETEYLEGLLKSLNVSDMISKPNHTIFAATNDAWSMTNSSTLPFGTLVHNLKYMSVQGVYYSCDFSINQTLDTDYRRNTLTLIAHDAIQGQTEDDIANLIMKDITTSMGVIHVVDKVLTADLVSSVSSSTDPLMDQTKGGDTPSKRPVTTTISNASRLDMNLFLLFFWLLSMYTSL